MALKVYVSGMSGNKEVKKRQQRVLMILDSKNIKYELVDITEPGKEAEKDIMQTKSGSPGATVSDPSPRHPLPPQIFNGEDYCGDYDAFDLANEIDTLDQFLKLAPADTTSVSTAQIELKNGEKDTPAAPPADGAGENKENEENKESGVSTEHADAIKDTQDNPEEGKTTEEPKEENEKTSDEHPLAGSVKANETNEESEITSVAQEKAVETSEKPNNTKEKENKDDNENNTEANDSENKDKVGDKPEEDEKTEITPEDGNSKADDEEKPNQKSLDGIANDADDIPLEDNKDPSVDQLEQNQAEHIEGGENDRNESNEKIPDTTVEATKTTEDKNNLSTAGEDGVKALKEESTTEEGEHKAVEEKSGDLNTNKGDSQGDSVTHKETADIEKPEKDNLGSHENIQTSDHKTPDENENKETAVESDTDNESSDASETAETKE